MHPHDELHWLAFCYVIDDLAPAEKLAFEDRLATDQAAREALAEAILLSHALAAVPQEVEASHSESAVSPAVRDRGTWHHPSGWIAAAVAACIAIIVVADSWLARGPQPVAVNTRNVANENLALAWASSAVSLDGTLSADLLIEGDEVAAVESDEGAMLVPSWMLEAVSTVAEAPQPREES